jgi:hypothetical protein
MIDIFRATLVVSIGGTTAANEEGWKDFRDCFCLAYRKNCNEQWGHSLRFAMGLRGEMPLTTCGVCASAIALVGLERTRLARIELFFS